LYACAAVISALLVSVGVLADGGDAWETWTRVINVVRPPTAAQHPYSVYLISFIFAVVLLAIPLTLLARVARPSSAGDASVRDKRPRARDTKRAAEIRGLAQQDELRARARYLKSLKADVENRLRVSIHNARLIDLGIDDTPLAAYVPWIFEDQSLRGFANLDEAFSAHEKRVLLLGPPGSGKTTTLLHLARRLLADAEENEDAPVPLLSNLSTLRLHAASGPLSVSTLFRKMPAAQEDSDSRVELWLAGELAKNPEASKFARKWVAGGRVAALLDGLDEVDDGQRAELVQLLNETYLKARPDTVVVVCSRTREYQPLQDRTETTLWLNRALTLRPLSDPQIYAYLEAARAQGLAAALRTDTSLYEMARTPLTLSMMTLAYGGMAPADIPADLSLSERRHHLMDTFVARMLQRKERRDRRLLFDGNPRNEVPEREYAYHPEQVGRYLGWLAVRLSVRAQTAFSSERFHSFVAARLERDETPLVRWAVAASGVPIVLAWVLLVCLPVVPATGDGVAQFLLITLGGALLYVLAEWLLLAPNGTPVVRVRPYLLIAGALATASLGLSVLAASLNARLSLGIPPIAMGLLATSLLVLVSSAISLVFTTTHNDSLPCGLVAITLATVLHIAPLAHLLPSPDRAWYVAAFVIAVSQLLTFGILSDESDRSQTLALIAATGVGVLVSIKLVGEPGWGDTVSALVSVIVCLLIVRDKVPLPLATSVLAFAVGGAVGGTVGAAAAATACCAGWLTAYSLGFDGETRWTKGLAQAGEHFRSPMLLGVLAAARALPYRPWHFVSYAESALLLKRSSSGIEFMHRLLRDYFALRELRPELDASTRERRLEAIRKLGFQGEATIPLLVDLATSSDPDVRAGSITSLGRIAPPDIIRHLEAALDDTEAQVRRAAVLATRVIRIWDVRRLLERLKDDGALSVREALLDIACEKHFMSLISHLVALARTDDNALLSYMVENADRGDLARAILELGDEGDRRAVEPLIKLLRNKRYGADAATMLGQLRDPRATQPLIRALSNRDEDVRQRAHLALFRMGHFSDRSAFFYY
jgi:HEAT repeat protein/energy-coupling factor transporter ATP-binding protein EcfA2